MYQYTMEMRWRRPHCGQTLVFREGTPSSKLTGITVRLVRTVDLGFTAKTWTALLLAMQRNGTYCTETPTAKCSVVAESYAAQRLFFTFPRITIHFSRKFRHAPLTLLLYKWTFAHFRLRPMHRQADAEKSARIFGAKSQYHARLAGA